MGILDAIQAAQSADERIKIDVPRWGGSVYFRPTTSRDMDNVLKRHPAFLDKPTLGAMIDMIIARAEDEDGAKVFDLARDRPMLMSEPVDIINMIGERIMGRTDPEEVEKN